MKTLLPNVRLRLLRKKTRKQAENPEWFEQRIGRLTASKHHEIYTKVNTIMASRSKKVHKTTPLVATILGKDKDWSHLPAFQYGREHEKDAKDAFIKLESLKHRSFTVKECGLYVHPQYPYIAASPDGLCVCRCCPDMVLEIKCPSSIENLPIQEGWNKTEFLEMRGESICLKTSHKYYTQVQGQLALAKCRPHICD